MCIRASDRTKYGTLDAAALFFVFLLSAFIFYSCSRKRKTAWVLTGPVPSNWSCTFQLVLYLPTGPAASNWSCSFQLALYLPTGPAPSNWSCTFQLVLYLPTGPVPSNWSCTFQLVLYLPTGPAPSNWSCTFQLVLHLPTGPVPSNWSCTFQLVLFTAEITFVPSTSNKYVYRRNRKLNKLHIFYQNLCFSLFFVMATAFVVLYQYLIACRVLLITSTLHCSNMLFIF